MNNINLQKLTDKAGKMALQNIWGENAYKINMAILKMDQNNCAAYTRLAKYYKLNGNIAEAKNMYLKVLDIDPKSRGAINNLEEIEENEKLCEAVDEIKTIKELVKAGQKSILKGKYKFAEKIFSKAYSVEPLLTHAVSLAGVYKKTGQYELINKLYMQLIDGACIQSDIDVIKNEFKTLLLKNSKSSALPV